MFGYSFKFKTSATCTMRPSPHLYYLGEDETVMDDDTEAEGGPRGAAIVPHGHNSWVVGDEPVVIIDFAGVKEYVRGSTRSPK